ncbi:MAG: hypothetical protein JXX28_13775 [Deltaproteobacteria bacterium]|nr:hypothetical protein [Deltaproteobacteria bacterium]
MAPQPVTNPSPPPRTDTVFLGVAVHQEGYALAVMDGAGALLETRAVSSHEGALAPLMELMLSLREGDTAPAVGGLGFCGRRDHPATDLLGIDAVVGPSSDDHAPAELALRAAAEAFRRRPGRSRFRGFSALDGELRRAFSCRGCVLGCAVQIYVEAGQRRVLGGSCDRWRRSAEANPYDRRALSLHHAQLTEPVTDSPRQVVIHWASPGGATLPLWAPLLRATGRTPVLAAEISEPPPAPACLPLREASAAMDTGEHFFPLPSPSSLACHALDLPEERVLRVPLGRDPLHPPAAGVARALGMRRGAAATALMEGTAALTRYYRELSERGRVALDQEERPIALLVGVPCALAQRPVYQTLSGWLTRQGLIALPVDALPDPFVSPLGHSPSIDALGVLDAALRTWGGHPRVFPILLRMGYCAPADRWDALRAALSPDKPRLELEADQPLTPADLQRDASDWIRGVWARAPS